MHSNSMTKQSFVVSGGVPDLVEDNDEDGYGVAGISRVMNKLTEGVPF